MLETIVSKSVWLLNACRSCVEDCLVKHNLLPRFFWNGFCINQDPNVTAGHPGCDSLRLTYDVFVWAITTAAVITGKFGHAVTPILNAPNYKETLNISLDVAVISVNMGYFFPLNVCLKPRLNVDKDTSLLARSLWNRRMCNRWSLSLSVNQALKSLTWCPVSISICLPHIL